MWTSINKKLYMFIGIILMIGIVIGIIFVVMLDEATKEIIFLNINELIQSIGNSHINNILSHILILSSLIILSILIIGLPINIFFMFYNGFSIGFIITSLTYIFGIKGTLFSLIYVIISKGIYLITLIILSITLIKLTINILEVIFKKSKIKNNIIILSKRIILCMIIIIISDIILYYTGGFLINLFNFLLY